MALATVAAAAAAWVAVPRSETASAVAPSQVVGIYRIKLRGDAWWSAPLSSYAAERVNGGATLTFTSATSDAADPRLRVEIRLDSGLTDGTLDLVTPNPAFLGEGYVVGDSMTVIDSGGPTYVNALTIQFLKDGERVVGHWLSAYPSTGPNGGGTGASGGAGIDFNGRRKPPARQPLSR